MPDQTLAAALLPRSQLVSSARERIIPAFQFNPDRRPFEFQSRSKRVLEVSPIMCRQPLRLIAVYHDDRRKLAALMRIPKPHLASPDNGRRVGGDRLRQYFVEPGRQEIAARCLVGDERRPNHIRYAAAM